MTEPKENTFVCAMCGGKFEKGWSEAEALNEMYETWGRVSPHDCDQVCDDCWEKVKPANNPDIFDAYKSETERKVPPNLRKVECCASCRFSNWLGTKCLKHDTRIEEDEICDDYKPEN